MNQHGYIAIINMRGRRTQLVDLDKQAGGAKGSATWPQ